MDVTTRFKEWAKTVPETIVRDSLWRITAYRQALFASELAWEDATALVKDKRTSSFADQLTRSVGSIGANVAEGYGKNSARDRARFYEYALGSARESRDWYYKSRHILGELTVTERLKFLEGIIRLLLVMVPDQRSYSVKEEQLEYQIDD